VATTSEMIGGAIGAVAGGAFGGPAGATAGYGVGKGIGSMVDRARGNEFTKAYDKTLSESLRKIRMGQSLAPSAAEVQQATMGAQQQALSVQQQQQADLERAAAMGGARQGAFFTAQQQLGQASADAVARERMANEMRAQSIGELRRMRALGEAKVRGAEITEQKAAEAQTTDPFEKLLAPGETEDSFVAKFLGSFMGGQ
jgi:outer membrane lipoprotein SlyB